jgi:hypothetical protein
VELFRLEDYTEEELDYISAIIPAVEEGRVVDTAPHDGDED